MSQSDLAERMGISKQVMSKIINGQKAINALEIKSIAEILDVDVNRLVEEKINQTNSQESLVMLMGEVNDDTKKELTFLSTVINEIDYLEDLLHE